MIVPLERIPVIYAIWNDITNDFYVGSAKDYRHRILTHLRELKANKHHSKYLQNSWNKHGNDSFEVFILKKSNINNLLSDEQWCLDILRPKYNSCKVAGNTLGLKWTEERRIKQLRYLSNKPKSHIDNLKKALKSNKSFVKMATDRCKLMCESNKISIVSFKNDILFKEFDSIKSCSNYFKVRPSTIRYYVTGKAKGVYKNKYKFKYKE